MRYEPTLNWYLSLVIVKSDINIILELPLAMYVIVLVSLIGPNTCDKPASVAKSDNAMWD